MENGGKRSHWSSSLHRCLELPWAEMILAVLCFHFALEAVSIVARIALVSLGIILLAKAIADIVKKRKMTRAPLFGQILTFS